MKSLIVLLVCTIGHGAPVVKDNITTTTITTDSTKSGKLTPLQVSCNNVTVCIKCQEHKCYDYDNITEKCTKSGQSKTEILLLQIFLGYLGVAAFTVGDYLWGSIQLCLALSPILWAFCYLCPFGEEATDLLAKIPLCLCYTAGIVIWIWYLIQIIENQLLGKNGCPLIE